MFKVCLLVVHVAVLLNEGPVSKYELMPKLLCVGCFQFKRLPLCGAQAIYPKP